MNKKLSELQMLISKRRTKLLQSNPEQVAVTTEQVEAPEQPKEIAPVEQPVGEEPVVETKVEEPAVEAPVEQPVEETPAEPVDVPVDEPTTESEPDVAPVEEAPAPEQTTGKKRRRKNREA